MLPMNISHSIVIEEEETGGTGSSSSYNPSTTPGFIYPLELEEDFEFGIPLIEQRRANGDMKPEPVFHRWVQLFYLSLLALLSDWICFSTAANPSAFESSYQQQGTDHASSSQLIDWFLFTNVATCFLVTDIVARYGLQASIQVSSILMMLGCWCRSGFWGTLYSVASWLGIAAEQEQVELVSYEWFVVGTLLVGAAQPFFQCTPPLLSAQWFAANERATSTAVALNFNQIGIATAFWVGGKMMVDTTGIQSYLSLITLLTTLGAIGTWCHFENLPAIPPSRSEWEKRAANHVEPPFLQSVKQFATTRGFFRPLCAFICSISITNIIGAFLDQVLERGGITNRKHIAATGSVFEIAIVLGGIVLGGYVDRTKAYKRVTIVCLVASMILVLPLGLTEHAIGKEPVILVLSLWLLGFFTGPIQPINAELAVDVTFPGCETAVESVQQIGGNFVSALLMPVAERAATRDYQLLPRVPWLASDVRGDVLVLLAVALGTLVYFAGFNAPLRRTLADRTPAD